MSYKLATFLLTLLIAGGIGSCSWRTAPEQTDQADAAASVVRRKFGTGPVKLGIELSAESITTADALTCRMTLRVADGYEAEFPDLAFPADLPGMILTHYDQRETKEDTRTLVVRQYELEPEYPGTFELPALQVYYHKGDEIREEMFETEPIELTVRETPASAEMLELRPFRGLVTAAQIEAERRRTWPWVVGGITGGVALLALALYWMRRPRLGPPPRPPHELAIEALRALAEKDLIAKGQIEPFFVEITGIVRDYLEWAFGLRAPEQTTEEFLANISSAPVVARHRDALEPFLAAADEVKFARARPEASTIQRSFDTARDFILQTSNTEASRGLEVRTDSQASRGPQSARTSERAADFSPRGHPSGHPKEEA